MRCLSIAICCIVVLAGANTGQNAFCQQSDDPSPETPDMHPHPGVGVVPVDPEHFRNRERFEWPDIDF